MSAVVALLNTYWVAVLLLAVAGVLAGVALFRGRAGSSVGWWVASAAVALAGVGGMLLPEPWALWIAVGALGALFLLFLIVLATGFWSRTAGIALTGLLLLGVGGLACQPAAAGAARAVEVLRTVEATQPWWLLLLVVVPLVVYFSYRSLAGLGPVRRWVALTLRASVLTLLVLALAEVRLRQEGENVTVFFLVDRSLSVPEEPRSDGQIGDLRWDRIRQFINDAVEQRGPGHDRDRAGLIVFGRHPRLELPASDARRFNFQEVTGAIDGGHTDIAGAIKLALASFPEGTGKRIVLISDGNQNLGDAEAQARIARLNGVQIDVVPLAAGQRNRSEVLVQSVEVPATADEGARLPIRVLIRSYNPDEVIGTLTVRQIIDGESTEVEQSPLKNVVLRPGMNAFTFKQPVTDKRQSYTYEATFLPEFIRSGSGGRVTRIPAGSDRVQNNRATAHVVARGQSRILFLESKAGEHQFLLDQLRNAPGRRFRIDSLLIDRLPANKDELGVFLSKYDSVVLANVPASDIQDGDVPAGHIPAAVTEDQMEMLRRNTHDQGCGLVMIGGPLGFGAGGWQGTPVEKALPVDCDIKSMEVDSKGGLVLIMHASEIAEGNRWQKEIANLAVKKLSPMDMVGVTYYSGFGGGHTWHVPFQLVGEDRSRIVRLISTMSPGDMPDVDPALEMAYKELTNPTYNLVKRHIIFISDGDHWNADPKLLAKLLAQKITCTTVCITSHGALEEQKMKAVADATRGRFYSVKNARALPAIYLKETRLVSQSFIQEGRFVPQLRFRLGPTEGLGEPEPLYGFVRTTAKQSPLVEIPLQTRSKGQDFPILAYWHYGLGKAAAFTSDARKAWDRDWAGSGDYLRFWEQTLDWTLRPVETKQLVMTTEQRDGKVRVIVDARDDKNRPLTELRLRGAVTPAGAKADAARTIDLKFEQTNSGTYEAEFKTEEAGSYFLNAQATRRVTIRDRDGKEREIEEAVDSVRAGVTVPYSPEFSDLESNTALLEQLRSITDGQVIVDSDQDLKAAAASGEIFREAPVASEGLQPVWFWLVMAAGILLFFDVGVRRVAFDLGAGAGVLVRWWQRLRGHAVTARDEPQFLDRLQSRKAAVGESMEKVKATRRFEGTASEVAPPAGAGETPAAPPAAGTSAGAPAGRPRSLAPEKEQQQQPQDYASRLLEAKKRIQEERNKGKKPDRDR